MARSGRRETISTREKSLSARSRSVGRVSGKSIMVPRIRSSVDSPRRRVADVIAGQYAEILQVPSSGSFRMTRFGTLPAEGRLAHETAMAGNEGIVSLTEVLRQTG